MGESRTFEIGLLLFPRMTQLDLTGPHEVLSRLPDSRLHLLWHSLEPVASDTGMRILPDQTFADCGELDLIFVPGGPGTDDLLDDEKLLSFVRDRGERASWVTSVCTGSLVLGAAGLLTGYRAGCHWASRHLLEAFGAIPDASRVVFDRNRVTGGGVAAGIDFGLFLAAHLKGTEFAARLQLILEYAPEPPLSSGRPGTATPEVLARVNARLAPMLALRRCSRRAACASSAPPTGSGRGVTSRGPLPTAISWHSRRKRRSG